MDHFQHRKFYVWLLLPLYYGLMSYMSVRFATYHISNHEFYGVMAAIGVLIIAMIWGDLPKLVKDIIVCCCLGLNNSSNVLKSDVAFHMNGCLSIGLINSINIANKFINGMLTGITIDAYPINRCRQ